MEKQEQLIRMLNRAELSLSNEPLSSIEIADIIWLATYFRQRQKQTEPVNINTNIQRDSNSNQTEKKKQTKDISTGNNNQTNKNDDTQGESNSESNSKTDQISVVANQNKSTQFSRTKIPFRVPSANAIPHSRKIARALRSLNQKVPSRRLQILDQSKTIKQTAEEEFCIPVLKPASRRWLDVVLIIETSPSYGIWQQTIKEFKNLLLLQGAFRDVKSWYANVDDRGKLVFKSQQGSRRNPKELIVPDGDRLILIVSDCVSSAWYSNAWRDWIKVFGKHHPITILQMLPPSFWLRTALGYMDSVWLSSGKPGALNHKWHQESATPWEEETPGDFPVPIVTLDPYALEIWAKGIAGASPTQLAGVYLQSLNFPPQNLERPTPSPEQVFEQFMDIASPTARRLAALLSAVPVQLPIVRLIQRSLLAKNSNAVHVAEIFFSGILKLIQDHPDPEQRFYDFQDGLRAMLNNTLPKQEIAGVIDKVSAYLARRVGVSIREFRAMLAVPLEQLESAFASEISEFARISKEVLRGLGKEYADFVTALDNGEIYLPDWGFSVKTFSFEVAEFIKSDNMEDELEELTFVIATIEIQETKTFESFTEDLGNSINLEMVAIPSGTFIMGSPEGEGYSDEKPQHEVTVQAFYMGKYPITQAQYQEIMSANPAQLKGDYQRPVECVTWDNAIEFCKQLSKQTGKKYRLPTEAEWEYACRSGTTSRYYFGGYITEQQANYEGSPYKTTTVGKYPSNDFGLYDMHGNVWEWCEDDWHENYENAPTDGHAWLSQESNRKIMRGGSWNNVARTCRSAYRHKQSYDFRFNDIGFRVVCVSSRNI
ncbi:MAG: formylglycine-generating enzyme family protein [Cyanobacteria bacterium P01_F01_bin.143]